MQLDGAIRVAMGHGEDLVEDPCVDRELFAQLARETRGQRFASIAFAARKFPVPFKVDALLTSGHQEPPVAFDDRRGYDDSRRHTQLGFIGQTRHFGFRAVHTVAPKSMSA